MAEKHDSLTLLHKRSFFTTTEPIQVVFLKRSVQCQAEASIGGGGGGGEGGQLLPPPMKNIGGGGKHHFASQWKYWGGGGQADRFAPQ